MPDIKFMSEVIQNGIKTLLGCLRKFNVDYIENVIRPSEDYYKMDVDSDEYKKIQRDTEKFVNYQNRVVSEILTKSLYSYTNGYYVDNRHEARKLILADALAELKTKPPEWNLSK